MTSRSYFRSSDGMSVDVAEACENAVLKEGYGMRGGTIFRDGAGNLTLYDCGQSARRVTVCQMSLAARRDE